MRWLFAGLLLALIVGISAQEEPRVLSITFSGWERRYFDDAFFARFEADHPGVKIAFVEGGFNSTVNTVHQQLDDFEAYAERADVLVVYTETLTKEMIEAGYLLDLRPLSAMDDLPAIATQPFTYQGGVWALPLAVDALVIGYDPARFDAAGLTYPDENWTLDDYANAARVLSRRNQSRPAFRVSDGESLIQRFARIGDNSEVDSLHGFPQLENIIRKWNGLEREGVITAEYVDAPLQMASFSASRREETALRLIPQGQNRFRAFGLAVSAGTSQPELAYELIKYIASDPRSIEAFEGVVGISSDEPLDTVFSDPLPFGDTLLRPYIGEARQATVDEANSRLVQNQAIAQERRASHVLIVQQPTPVITVIEPSVLRFGVFDGVSVNLTSQQTLWDGVIEAFLVENPDITAVQLSNLPKNPERDTDCFYRPGSMRQIPPARLSLDPLIAADASFDEDDFMLGALDEVTVDGRIWGYPLTITPYVVWYNDAKFAGLPLPQSGWTMTDFENVLTTLEAKYPGEPVLMLRDFINQLDIFLLMALYGALPVDVRTDPPTHNLTDEDNIQIMRKILDEIKSGRFKTAFGAYDFVDTSLNDIPLYIDRLGWGFGGEGVEGYTPVPFPISERYTPVSYMVGVGYISTAATNPEGCYRLLRTLAEHPELFYAMPARLSQLDNPVFQAAHGENVVAFYRDYASGIEEAVPIRLTNATVPMYEIFREYIFNEGVDLAERMTTLEGQLREFQICVDAIEQPPYNPLVDDGAAYLQPYLECERLAGLRS